MFNGILLDKKDGWSNFLTFQLSIISCACLLQSGLKITFHWKVQLVITFRCWLKVFAFVWMFFTTEKREVSSKPWLKPWWFWPWLKPWSKQSLFFKTIIFHNVHNMIRFHQKDVEMERVPGRIKEYQAQHDRDGQIPITHKPLEQYYVSIMFNLNSRNSITSVNALVG